LSPWLADPTPAGPLKVSGWLDPREALLGLGSLMPASWQPGRTSEQRQWSSEVSIDGELAERLWRASVSSAGRAAEVERPRLRGVLHQWAFVVAVALAPLVAILAAPDGLARAGAVAFGITVAAMFGASALYHRVTWRPHLRPWIRRVDHAMIYMVIAGSYTPFGLLVLHGAWRIAILAIVWTGAAAGIAMRLVWIQAPKWISAAIAVALGWVGVLVFPQIVQSIGVAGASLLVLEGVAYTVGAIVYARRRPDPLPALFGYHELFHALVIVGIGLQYAAVAFFILPAG
jgi:hemolysin III